MTPTTQLALAIVCEIVATTALKQSDGGTRILPVIAATLGYVGAFALFAGALRSLPVGVAYAIWAGCGTVGAALVGYALFDEQLGGWQIAGMTFVLIGVAVLHVAPPLGQEHHLPDAEQPTQLKVDARHGQVGLAAGQRAVHRPGDAPAVLAALARGDAEQRVDRLAEGRAQLTPVLAQLSGVDAHEGLLKGRQELEAQRRVAEALGVVAGAHHVADEEAVIDTVAVLHVGWVVVDDPKRLQGGPGGAPIIP